MRNPRFGDANLKSKRASANTGKKAAMRTQSGLEYLMTYGWSIVVIALVIAVLFTLGVFNGNSGGGTSTCISISGYQCSGITLTSAGTLSATVGEIGSALITLTASGCGSNSTEPTMVPLPSSVSLSSGQTSTITASCFTGTRPLGTKFTGYLWIKYSSSGSLANTIVRVAVLRAIISNPSTQAAPVGNAYVPITITNSQPSATGSAFLQMLAFNPSQSFAYTSNEATDLGNIRFYQGSTELYSWCESGCSSSSSNAVFWINIPSGISAGGTATVNMYFLSNTVEYDDVFAGEAPGLSHSYAEYDNGASTFGSLYSQICPPGGNCQPLPQYVANFSGISGSYISTSTNVGSPYQGTLGFWVKYNGQGQGTSFAAGMMDDEPGLYIRVQYNNLGVGQGVHAVGDFNAGSISYNWGYYTITWGGSNANIYLNGVLEGSGSDGGNIFLNSLTIGEDDTGAFNGLMSDIQVYNAPLSQGQITTLYDEGIGGLNVLASNAVSQWQLNGNPTDSIGSNGGTAYGGITYSYLLSSPPGGVMPTASFGAITH